MDNNNNFSIASLFGMMGFKVTSDSEYELPSPNDTVVIRGTTLAKYSPYNPNGNMLKLIIPEGVKTIGKEVFAGDDNGYLECCRMPEGLTRIGDYAFANTNSLWQVIIPSTLTKICEGAFLYSHVREIELPEGLKTLGDRAFYHCRLINYLRIPSTVTSIGEDCFLNMGVPLGMHISPGADISAPSSLKKIYDEDYLDELFKGHNVEWYEGGSVHSTRASKESSVFDEEYDDAVSANTGNAKKKTTSRTKHFYADADSVATPAAAPKKPAAKPKKPAADEPGLFKKYSGSDETFTIPDGITRIGTKAFCGNKTLKKVVAPEGLKEIGESAFSGCTDLEEIILPDSVEYIGSCAFKDCVSLKDFTVPGNTVNIYGNTFKGCMGLRSLTMGSSVEYIHTTFGCGDFDGVNGATFCTPAGSYAEKYMADHTCKWQYRFTTLLNQLPAGKQWPVCTLGETELKKQRELKIAGDVLVKYSGDQETFIIPDTIKTIGDAAFRGNKTVRRIVIPNTVTAIKESVFEECENLESIEVPYGVKIINRYVFEKCKSLKYVTLPETVTKINWWAFYGCCNLKSVNIPASVTFIDKDAFKNGYGIDNDVITGLTIYGTPGTIAQKYADAKGYAFRSGLPVGVPAPRTADTPDPTVEALKEQAARLEREEAERIEREKRAEEARIAAAKRAEEERAAAERRRLEAERKRQEEEARVRAVREQIAALQNERAHWQEVAAANKGIFGEKARRRKEANAKVAEITYEIARLESAIR